MTDLAARAEVLRALHRPGDPLVLPNAWDVASARALAAAGAPAIATSSAALARALGYDDGELTPAAELLDHVGRIARAVDVPVTADMERGYGLAPADLVAGLLEAGAVGLNFEDSRPGDGSLVDVDEQADVVRALVDAGRAHGVPVVVNARVDVFVRGDATAGRVDEAVRRANAYLAAGATCAYPILAPETDLPALVAAIDGPVNVHAVPDGAGRRALAAMGVARVSFGTGLARVALDAAVARVDAFLAA